MDDELKHVVMLLRRQLTESRHNLIETQRQIIEYLNQVKHQSRIQEKIKQVKYLKEHSFSLHLGHAAQAECTVKKFILANQFLNKFIDNKSSDDD